MKTKALMVIVFLLLCSAILASGNDSEAEEYWRKTQELNQMAERFKAETGFVGDITFKHQDMKCATLTGTFCGIEVTALQDTTSMKQVFNQLVSRILQYISAREEELFMGKVVSNDLRTNVRFTQKVNGYDIEHGGYLNISYIKNLKRFTVIDNTVYIRTRFVVPTVSIDKARQIYHELVLQDETIQSTSIPPSIRLIYYDINHYNNELDPDYRLCWVIGGDKLVVLDAVSEAIYINRGPSMIHDKVVNVNGTVIISQNDDGFPYSTMNFPDSFVQAEFDGNICTEATNSDGNCSFIGNSINVLLAALQSDRFSVLVNSTYVVNSQPTVVDSEHSDFFFDDCTYPSNPCNVYYQATKFSHWFSDNIYPNVFGSDDVVSIITNYSSLPILHFGGYDEELRRIFYSQGADIYSSVICHEIMHYFVDCMLEAFFNPDHPSLEVEKGCMDESFSIYYPCASRNNATYRNPVNNLN